MLRRRPMPLRRFSGCSKSSDAPSGLSTCDVLSEGRRPGPRPRSGLSRRGRFQNEAAGLAGDQEIFSGMDEQHSRGRIGRGHVAVGPGGKVLVRVEVHSQALQPPADFGAKSRRVFANAAGEGPPGSPPGRRSSRAPGTRRPPAPTVPSRDLPGQPFPRDESRTTVPRSPTGRICGAGSRQPARPKDPSRAGRRLESPDRPCRSGFPS